MRFTKYIVSALIPVLLVSCSSIKLEKLTPESKISKVGIIYTLPKTKLNIIADVVKTTYYKGPFSEFADEYLGIENVVSNNFIEYKLSDINIVPTIENDNNYTYLLTNYSKNIKSVEYFAGTQVISAINTNSTKKNIVITKKDFEEKSNFVPFKDRTVKPLVVEKSDTVWKTILVDSIYKRIPKVNTAIAPRTIKEQAYLASRFILKIRKRRLRVLTAMDGKFPSGSATKKILKELNNLENNYLDLFTGIEINDTATYNFSIVPDSNLTSVDLFNFDKQRGVSKNSKYSVSLMLTDDNKNPYYDKFNKITAKKSDFIYKKAKFVNVNILVNSNVYKSFFVPIYQVGIINYLPSEFTKNKIVFDKETGEYSIND